MFSELRTIFAKYSNEDLADLVDELNDLEYIQPIKKGQAQVQLEV